MCNATKIFYGVLKTSKVVSANEKPRTLIMLPFCFCYLAVDVTHS